MLRAPRPLQRSLKAKTRPIWGRIPHRFRTSENMYYVKQGPPEAPSGPIQGPNPARPPTPKARAANRPGTVTIQPNPTHAIIDSTLSHAIALPGCRASTNFARATPSADLGITTVPRCVVFMSPQYSPSALVTVRC